MRLDRKEHYEHLTGRRREGKEKLRIYMGVIGIGGLTAFVIYGRSLEKWRVSK